MDYKYEELMKLREFGNRMGDIALAFYALAPDKYDQLEDAMEDLLQRIDDRLGPIVDSIRSDYEAVPGRDQHGCPAGTVPCRYGCCYPTQWPSAPLEGPSHNG
jgi:hypothetical protein